MTEITDSILLARSERRERCDVDEGWHWNEYRVRRVTDREFRDLREAGLLYRNEAFHPFLLEQRHVRMESGCPEECGQWEPWQAADTLREAIRSCLGDTAYFEAESLYEVHAEEVAYLRRRCAAERLVGQAKDALASRREDVETYKIDSNRAFAKRAAGLPSDKVEATRKRMLRTRGPRMEELRAAVRTAEEELRRAEESLAAVTSPDSSASKIEGEGV